MEPSLLAGTIIGVFLHTISPRWFVITSLIIVLGYGSYSTVLKGIAKYKQQQQQNKNAVERFET
jgi:F0F1-type ATP synthase assembly protein I